MKNLKTFEDYSDLDKQDKERAERNQISNFPHSAKEVAKKREKIEKRSRKEDPDGMYPRDDKRYDDSNNSSYQGGWQDGMGKPSWLGESVEDNQLEYNTGVDTTSILVIWSKLFSLEKERKISEISDVRFGQMFQSLQFESDKLIFSMSVIDNGLGISVKVIRNDIKENLGIYNVDDVDLVIDSILEELNKNNQSYEEI